MLAHQLPALPPVSALWDALPEFFTWLWNGEAPVVPGAYKLGRGETTIRERTMRLPLRGISQSYIEVIRFAATNRLCVDLDYQCSTRRIEPYSLRRTQDDNIILHAWSVDKDEHRSYRVDRIQGARTTGQTFSPRYAVELTPEGPVSMPPTQRSSRSEWGGSMSARSPSRPRRQAARPFSTFSQGPIYVYECSYCGKKFRRKKQNVKLNPHKTPDGYPCSGRTGYLVDTKY